MFWIKLKLINSFERNRKWKNRIENQYTKACKSKTGGIDLKPILVLSYPTFKFSIDGLSGRFTRSWWLKEQACSVGQTFDPFSFQQIDSVGKQTFLGGNMSKYSGHLFQQKFQKLASERISETIRNAVPQWKSH